MTRLDDGRVTGQKWPFVDLPDEQKNAMTDSAQVHLLSRLKTLIECLSDFDFGTGHVPLVLMEATFIEYGKAVLTSAAQIINGADADVCLSVLRRHIMPEIIMAILPRADLFTSAEPTSPLSLTPDGLWEELLDRAYAAARTNPPNVRSLEMNASGFRAHYTFRLRRERFCKAFRQKLEAALTVAVREVGRGVRQRLSPTISEIRAQERQRRRSQVMSEQQLFSDPRLFGRDWPSDVREICLAFEGRIAVPEPWRTRKNINTWSEISEMIETDRALRSRVQKYIRRRLVGTRATKVAERTEKAG